MYQMDRFGYNTVNYFMIGVTNVSNSVSNRQIILLVFIAVTTTYTIIDLPKYMVQSAGRSSWLPIVLTSVVFAVLITMIVQLNKMYPQKILFDYTKDIAGSFFAYLFSIFYILYFIIVEVHLNIKLLGILALNFFPKTPQFIILLLLTGLSAYLSAKGLRNICRLIEYTGIAFLAVTLIICVFMITNGDKYNVLPIFNTSDFKDLTGMAKELMLPFAGIEILTIVPFAQENKKVGKKLFLAILLIGLLDVLIVESTIKILGVNNTVIFSDSFFEAIKATPVPVIERLDIIYLTFGFGSLFTGFGVMFVAIVEHAGRIMPKVSRNKLVIITGVIVFALSFAASKINGISGVLRNVVIYLVIAASIAIPLSLFIAAKIKRSVGHSITSGVEN